MNLIAIQCAEFLLEEQPTKDSINPPFRVPFLFDAPTLAKRPPSWTSRTLEELKETYKEVAERVYREAQETEIMVRYEMRRWVSMACVEPNYVLWVMAHADIIRDAMRLLPHLYNARGKIKDDEARRERYVRLLDAVMRIRNRMANDRHQVRLRIRKKK